MKKIITIAASVLALTINTPAWAQDNAGDGVTTAEENLIDPARLAAAETTVDYLFPLGTYERMMKGTMDQIMDSVLSGVSSMTLGDMAGAVAMNLCVIGDRLGLFKDLAANGPADPTTFASRNQVDGRYAREWLEALAAAGYLIRTRTDSPTGDARTGSTERREAAIASGAHYLSSDYYIEDPALGTGYVVVVEDRCNPVTAPPDCDPAELVG